MKKNALTAICLAAVLFLIAGCSAPAAQSDTAAAQENTTQQEATAQEATTQEATVQETTAQLDEEVVKLSTISLAGTELSLPVSYTEFSEKTGYGFSNNLNTDYTEETRLPAYTTLALIYEIKDGNLILLLANQTDKEIAAKDGSIIGVKLSRYQKNDSDLAFEYQGVDWESSHDEIAEVFGESESLEENHGYFLSGYSTKRDENSNISYSFVTDDEKLYSFALSIDNMTVTYDSLGSTTEETTE